MLGRARLKDSSSPPTTFGGALFKRRKPDEVPIGSGAPLPAGITAASSSADDAATQTVVHPASTFGSSSGSGDTGLGVPPFRPAPPKEAQLMSRPPL